MKSMKARHFSALLTSILSLALLGTADAMSASGDLRLSKREAEEAQRIYAEEIEASRAIFSHLSPDVFNDYQLGSQWRDVQKAQTRARGFLRIYVECRTCERNGGYDVIETPPEVRVQATSFGNRLTLGDIDIGKALVRTVESDFNTYFIEIQDESYELRAVFLPRDYKMPISTPIVDTFYGAAANGDTTQMKAIISELDDVNQSDVFGSAPLNHAAYFGRVEIVNLLLKKGGDIHMKNKAGDTPLTSAVSGGSVDVTKLLLDRGAEVDSRDNLGGTPLQVAATRGHISIVELLIKYGADVNISQNYGFLNGKTALHSAANRCRTDIVALLIKHGANANATDATGLTPLMAAASSRGCIETVATLLANGADVNARSEGDTTALTWASEFGDKEVVEILLQAGAKVRRRDIVGAEKWRRDDIENLLQKRK